MSNKDRRAIVRNYKRTRAIIAAHPPKPQSSALAAPRQHAILANGRIATVTDGNAHTGTVVFCGADGRLHSYRAGEFIPGEVIANSVSMTHVVTYASAEEFNAQYMNASLDDAQNAANEKLAHTDDAANAQDALELTKAQRVQYMNDGVVWDG